MKVRKHKYMNTHTHTPHTHSHTLTPLTPGFVLYHTHSHHPTTHTPGKGGKRKRVSKPCKCGSTSHKRTTSKLCPLNKKRKLESDRSAVKRMVMAGAAARRAAAVAAAAGGAGATPSVAAGADAGATPSDAAGAGASTSDAAPTTPDTPSADDTNPTAAAVTQQLTPPPPVPVRQSFQLGVNVHAEWKRGQWFLGQVTGFDNGRYTVYFLFGKSKSNLRPAQVRASDSTYPERRDMWNKDFFFDGAPDLPKGVWRVGQILEDENRYKCTRITGGGDQNVECFDIGYVIKQYVKGRDQRREDGIGTVLKTRTRRAPKGTHHR